MKHQLWGIAASACLALLPVSAIAQSIPALNAQLKQAVAARNWERAIQIVDSLLVAAPGQAAALNSYKGQLLKLKAAESPALGQSSTSPIPVNIVPGTRTAPRPPAKATLIITDLKYDGFWIEGRVKNLSKADITEVKVFWEACDNFGRVISEDWDFIESSGSSIKGLQGRYFRHVVTPAQADRVKVVAIQYRLNGQYQEAKVLSYAQRVEGESLSPYR